MKEINSEVEKYAFPKLRTKAPIANGMKRRNENFAAFSFGMPRKSEDEIVMPDLETPGKSARVWKRPISNAFFELSFLEG